jgi:hypothetical protein
MRQYTRPEGVPPRRQHYFTTDGTYGNASDVATYDTTLWTDEDWQQIEDCSDGERYNIAKQIHQRRINEMVERATRKVGA